MAKTFFKSMYVMFLWLIVLINLVLAFGLQSELPLVGVTGYASTDTYFGMSTLIDFLSNLDESSFPFLSSFKGWITGIQKIITAGLEIDWSASVFPEINNPADFFAYVGNLLLNILKVLGNMIIYVAMLPFWLAYYFMMIVNIAFVVMRLMSGYYAQPIPSSGLLDSIMLPMQALV